MGIFDRFKSMMDSKLNIQSRYELLREAISGTMSSFYMARDKKSGEVVGLKILDKDKTSQFEGRFKGLKKPPEGQIASSFDHPRIVKTLEYGATADGGQYVVMEFLDGPGLNSLIMEKSAKLNGNRLKLMKDMAEGLAVVHDAGYIHRDICPRNFICDKSVSSLKLIDFGLTVPATKEFMQPGNRTGTPNYMAPEVVRRRPTDQRLDIFSLGVTFYQLCALELPWPSGDVTGKAAMLHDTKEPIPLSEVCNTVPAEIDAMIMQCLAKNPQQRPKSVAEIIKVLDSVKSADF